jgi:hypothetical protein
VETVIMQFLFRGPHSWVAIEPFLPFSHSRNQ